MDVPYFDILGSTMVTSQQIRLTPNTQGRQGAIWNSVVRWQLTRARYHQSQRLQPVQSRDWELVS